MHPDIQAFNGSLEEGDLTSGTGKVKDALKFHISAYQIDADNLHRRLNESREIQAAYSRQNARISLMSAPGASSMTRWPVSGTDTKRAPGIASASF